MNLERFGELSFLLLSNGRLFTELGEDVTDEIRRVFGQPFQDSDSTSNHHQVDSPASSFPSSEQAR